MLIKIPAYAQVTYLYHPAQNLNAAIEVELAQQAQLELVLDLTDYPTNLDLSFKFKLIGAGASVKLVSRARLRRAQIVKIQTEQQHLAPNTTSDLLLKTVCFDQAQWWYDGKILVAPAAHDTVASQLNYNLLLGAAAQAHAVPALEVLTQAVRCTHGSAMGPVDPDSLCYLMARGLTASAAEAVLIASFLD